MSSTQAIIVTLVVFAALLPLALLVRNARGRALAAVSVLLLSVAIVWSTAVSREPVGDPPSDRPIEVRNDGYVSSNACRSCHPSNYGSWHASYHRTMTQIATPEAILSDFDGVVLNSGPHEYHLRRRGDEFWVETDDPNWTGVGERPPRVERKVVMTTGSHHQQIYWLGEAGDRKVQYLPFVYLVQEKRWISRDSAFLSPPDRKRTAQHGLWNVSCNRCHATRGQPRVKGPLRTYQTSPMDTHVAEFGIACEACHGPGHNHVEANRHPIRRYQQHLLNEPDPTIVNPNRLTHELSSQTCGQCHSINFVPSAEEIPNWSEHGFRYRPGERLDDTRLVFRHHDDKSSPRRKEILKDPTFLRDRFWPDGMVRVSGREYNGLIETPCYERGESTSTRA